MAEKESSNAMLVAIVAIVAVVGLVVLWSSTRGPNGALPTEEGEAEAGVSVVGAAITSNSGLVQCDDTMSDPTNTAETAAGDSIFMPSIVKTRTRSSTTASWPTTWTTVGGDGCSGSTLTEWSCLSGYATAISAGVTCANGCESGRCLPPPCTDPDGTETTPYLTKSTTTGLMFMRIYADPDTRGVPPVTQAVKSYTDSCGSSTSVYEYRCEWIPNTGYKRVVGRVAYSCTNLGAGYTCNDGRCVPPTPQPTVTVEGTTTTATVTTSGTESTVQVGGTPVLTVPTTVDLSTVTIQTADGGDKVAVSGLTGTTHYLYLSSNGYGAYVCPTATTTSAVTPTCSGKVTYTHTQCTTAGNPCQLVGSQYKIAVSGSGAEAVDPETVCDNLDNNGNGVVDEGCDDDNDNFCDPVITKVYYAFSTCVGSNCCRIDTAVDCDDGDAAIRPGAMEVCGNGVDENCYSADDACPTCTDSDGGNNPTVGGSATGNTHAGSSVVTESDSCTSSSLLRDAVCVPGYSGGMVVSGINSTCSTGSCIDPDGSGSTPAYCG